MSLRHHERPIDALNAQTEEAVALAQLIIAKLRTRAEDARVSGAHWGHVGDAAHARGELERLAASFFYKECGGEEDRAHEKARKAAGL